MPRTDWYPDPTDGLWTTELDPDAILTMHVTWTGVYTGVTGVAPLAPVSEGGNVAVAVNLYSDTGMTFTVTGAGGRITFRVAFAGGQSDDLTLRFRSVSS